MAIMKPFVSQDAAHGALPTLFAAVAHEAVPGGYYGPDGLAELKGHPTAVRLAEKATDPALARRLWAESERLTKVQFATFSPIPSLGRGRVPINPDPPHSQTEFGADKSDLYPSMPAV